MADTVLADDFDVVVEHDVMVVMRDGVRLATDIHRPARDGKPVPGSFPVLFERTPYGKTGLRESEGTSADPRPRRRADVAAHFVRSGYVVIFQDCRGRYASEGAFTKYLGEAEDGFDSITWITSQPWCSGRLGTFGMSYASHAQTALVALRPSGLSAMLLDSGGFANAFRGGIRHGGAFELKQATWAYKQAALSLKTQGDQAALAALEKEDIAEWFKDMPWSRDRSPLHAAPEYETYLFDQWEHGTFDDYWRAPELFAANHYDAFDGIPVMLLCGWWDPYAQTTSDNYLGISRRPRGNVCMVLGPWLHGKRSFAQAGDVDFGAAATLDGNIADDYYAFRTDWFDRWLKPLGGNARDLPPVRYFRMGGGEGGLTGDGLLRHGGSWQSANDWPVPSTDFCAFYLHADGSLSDCKPVEESAALSFEFDPANPVPTIGGAITSGEPVMVGGAFDQRTGPDTFGATPPFGPLADRPDVLVFETAPLEEDVEITGPIEIRLWISSDAPDTDFTAKLIDHYPPGPDNPDGFAMNLTDGILRCRYRNSWEKPEALNAGEIARIMIEPMPASNLFKKGHRIRLDISSSNFPHFDVNPNTFEPEGKAIRRQCAVNTVHMDRLRPSHVILPLIPASRK